jgi:fibronectin-binding autotransporter adhesin
MKKMRNHLLKSTLIILALLATCLAPAAPFEWTGASGIDWITPANWNPSGPPGAADDARFADAGTVFDLVTINNNVTTDTTVQQLWLGQGNGGIHNMQINAGVTLTVANAATDGPSLLIAGTETEVTATTIVSNTISGDGSLVIAGATEIDGGINQQNIVGSISVAQKHGSAGNHWATLDLRNLANFSATAALFRIGWSDTTLRRAQGYVILAKTNNITVAGGDGEAGISVGDNRGNNNNNSGFSVLWLGQENNINANTVRFGSQKSQGRLFFNPELVSPSFQLRGTDGIGRTEIFAVGDNHQQGASGNPCAGTVDLSSGTVDLLIDTMYVARGQTSTGRESVADVTFGAGVVNVNTLEVGYQSAPNAASGNNNRVDGDLTLNGTTVAVNNVLRLGRWGGSPEGWIFARLFVTNGATLMAQSISSEIVNADSVSLLSVENSTVIVTNTATGLSTVSLTDSLLRTVAIGAATVVATAELTTGGAGNTIQIGRLPGILSYPAQFRLIDYDGAIGGAGYNFTMTGLNVAYTGFLSNNTVDGAVDLVLTAGPVAQNLTWNGSPNGVWNTGNLNWRAGATATNYSDGDFPVFDDTATGTTMVDVTTELFPGDVAVDNSTKNYMFTGSGAIAGLASLVKDGSGTLTVANNNSYLGTTTIAGGTMQIGNGGTTGSLGSGPVNNDAGLVFNRSDNFTVANVIAGDATGTLTKNGAGVLTLSAANTFAGAVSVVQGTLQAGSASALGDNAGGTLVSSGATLDVNAQNLGAEPVTVSGTGVGGSGAIINSGGQQLNALRYVTLAGNTTFGNPGRWDIRGAPSTADPANAGLSTSGNAYTLTKIGTNTIALVGVTVDPALGDVDIQAGTLAVEATTTGLGNPAANLTVQAGATLQFFNMTNQLNKVITLNGSGTNNTVNAADGALGLNYVLGPMTLNGECWMNVNGGDFMTFHNAITGVGGASFIKQGDGTLILSGPVKTYSGNTTVSNGTLVLNTTLSGGGTLTVLADTTLSGTGTNTGPVIVGGTLAPGTSAGTFGSGDLTLLPGVTLAFELAPVNTIGSGVNDLIQVNGDLTVNDNAFTFSLLGAGLQAGTYRLINYTGSLIGNLNTSASLGGLSRYAMSIDTNTPGQVNLIVSGSAGNLVWNSTSSTAWDVGVSSNWFNGAIPGADAFFQADNVLFDDAAGLMTIIDISADVAVSPATLTVNSTNNYYVINGPGRISGGASLVKQGDSMLILNSTNDYTGTVAIQQGTLQIGNNSALGSDTGETIVSNGATLDVGAVTFAANAVNIGLEPIVVSGAGVFGQGAIVNNTLINQQNAVRVVTLTGHTTLGGNGRWDIRGAGATLSTGGNAYNLTKVGANQITLVGVAVDPAFGNVDVQQGIFSIETTSTAGDPTKTFAIQSGATLQFFNLSFPLDKKVALTNATINNDSGNNVISGPVLLDGFCTIDVDPGTSLTINSISGTASLNKVETGTLNLIAGGYNGDTTINAGTLALVGTASLAGSPNLTMTAGAVDVSGRVDGTLSLVGGQRFSANGTVTGSLMVGSGTVSVGGDFATGRLTVTGAAVFGAGSTNVVDAEKFGFTNDVLNATSITYGGRLIVNAVSLPFGAGDSFKLFNADSYAGSFAAIEPATPGAGLMWDTSNLAVNGTLRVASTTPLAPPDISTFVYSGFDVTLGSINGPAYGPYRILATTNLALPLASWSVLTTNYFDASGQINPPFNALVNPGQPQQFFLLSLP